jgi:hypothetical protein
MNLLTPHHIPPFWPGSADTRHTPAIQEVSTAPNAHHCGITLLAPRMESDAAVRGRCIPLLPRVSCCCCFISCHSRVLYPRLSALCAYVCQEQLLLPQALQWRHRPCCCLCLRTHQTHPHRISRCCCTSQDFCGRAAVVMSPCHNRTAAAPTPPAHTHAQPLRKAVRAVLAGRCHSG